MTITVVAGTASTVFTVLVYTGGAYPARPSSGSVPAGSVRYVGPVVPTTWLTGDEWVDNS